MQSHLGGSIDIEHSYGLGEEGDETILKQKMVAYGAISDEAAEGIRSHGDLKATEPQLRAYVETA